MEGLKIVAVVLVVIFLTLLVVDIISPAYGWFARVDSGYVGIVTKFGKIEDRVEAKQVATQEAQRAKTLQEQQTMEARQEAERKKISAEASAEYVRQKADAEAYETKVKAEAQAEANRLITETITNDLIDYVEAQRWDGKLPGIYASSGALPIITTPTEAK